MPGGKCVFNKLWLEKEDYKDWLLQHDRFKGKCCVCSKVFDISGMGESAIKMHMKGLKHKSLLEAKNKSEGIGIKDFFKPTAKEVLQMHSVASEKNAGASTSVSNTIDSFSIRNEVLDAEILWALKVMKCHHSYKSSEDASKLFEKMFPDSNIAKQFSCGERKCAYLCQFGLAPYFHSLLFKCFDSSVSHYTLLFDETLNRSNQRKQMDIHIRFWHPEEHKVRTRYLTSKFIGHSTATVLLKSFYEATEKLDFSKLLQISMDGPSVNWKFYEELQEDLSKEYGIQTATVGSCGLHILNNAFRNGVNSTGWNISSILSSLYWIFKDSPARREDYMKFSETQKFPSKFCNCRWLENCPAAERAIEIWSDVVTFVRKVENGSFSKVKCKSFAIVAEATKDSLILIKLNFFLSVAKVLRPFLIMYQSDNPMLPFFAGDVFKLVKHCLELFNVLPSEQLNVIKSAESLCKFDFSNKEVYGPIHKVKLGFIGNKILKEMLFKKELSEGDSLRLKHEAQGFIFKMLESLMFKCPVTYSLVRDVACIDPRKMVTNELEKSKRKMNNILSYFSKRKLISEKIGDEVLVQFGDFLSDIVMKSKVEFLNFDPKTTSVDLFLYEYLKEKKFSKLFDVFKMVFVLSHGQASVERGFSINKAIEVENLKEDAYISHRIICDHIKFCGSIFNVEITKELRLSASAARLKYNQYREEQLKLKENANSSIKRKSLKDDIEYLKKKRQCIQTDITQFEKEADAFAAKGEASSDIEFFLKSNSLRKLVKEKSLEIIEIDSKIFGKKTDLKKLQ